MHLELHRRKAFESRLTAKLLTKSNHSSVTTPAVKGLLILGALVLSTGCASQLPAPTVDASKRSLPSSSNTNRVPTKKKETFGTATPLPERDINVERAEYYQNLAASGNTGSQQIDAQLSAAENYIQAQRFSDAEQRIIGLNTSNLSKAQQDRLAIINAYISYERRDYYGALSKLNTLLLEITPPSTPNKTEESEQKNRKPSVARLNELNIQQVDALLLSSFCHQKLGNHEDAISALITREGALVGAARSETTRYIWQVINAIGISQRQSIINESSNPLVANRLEQSLQGQVSQRDVAPLQFSQWRDDQSISTSTNKKVVNNNWNANSPRKIAVLLPLSSKFNKAAQAVMDGIKYQNENNSSAYRPELQFYDIGANAGQVTQYYNAAVKGGADFVIGPLGKSYANQVARQTGSRTPTILLGGDAPVGGSTTRLTKSPELEGIRVAQRAIQDGHINAAILASDSAYNRRVIDAFKSHWLQAGGKINSEVNYDKNQYDHSPQLKQMFSINNSEGRYTRLSNTLGFKPKFSAYQRNDLDFIFMLADNESGRIVRPQINFFSGSKIPVYSTSDIFNGIPDSINNMDLDNTQFPIMPWVFKSKETASYAGQLNMLFAMGADAYLVAGNFNALRQSSDAAINANTGQITINSNSEISYQPLWAKFKKGEATLLEPYTGDITPQSIPRSLNGINTSNKKGIYNDKTWDSGESRRKTGS